MEVENPLGPVPTLLLTIIPMAVLGDRTSGQLPCIGDDPQAALFEQLVLLIEKKV